MNLVTLVQSWFFVDKEKRFTPLRVVRISDLIGSVVSNGNNVGGQVVLYMELFMKHMDRVAVLAC